MTKIEADYLHDGGPCEEHMTIEMLGYENGYVAKITFTDATDYARLPAVLVHAYRLFLTGIPENERKHENVERKSETDV